MAIPDADDMSTPFQNEFGETVEYTIKGGSPANITAVVDEEEEAIDIDDNGRVSSFAKNINVADADVPLPKDGDTVKIAGLLWTVRQKLRQIGAMSELRITRKVQETFGSENLHRPVQ